MADMYSSPTERAKDEYWLNQDRIQMTMSERIDLHKCDCIMALKEEISLLREQLGDQVEFEFTQKLWAIEKNIK